jgi:hypothetical protein
LAVDEALTQLADKHPEKAELVKLHYFAGLTLPEAASMLGISTAGHIMPANVQVDAEVVPAQLDSVRAKVAKAVPLASRPRKSSSILPHLGQHRAGLTRRSTSRMRAVLCQERLRLLPHLLVYDGRLLHPVCLAVQHAHHIS